MKTTISGLILGGVMAFSLAACNTTPMNSDSGTGSSRAGMTGSSDSTTMNGTDMNRTKAQVNCKTNTNADGTNAADTPGAKCPTESH